MLHIEPTLEEWLLVQKNILVGVDKILANEYAKDR